MVRPYATGLLAVLLKKWICLSFLVTAKYVFSQSGKDFRHRLDRGFQTDPPAAKAGPPLFEHKTNSL